MDFKEIPEEILGFFLDFKEIPKEICEIPQIFDSILKEILLPKALSNDLLYKSRISFIMLYTQGYLSSPTLFPPPSLYPKYTLMIVYPLHLCCNNCCSNYRKRLNNY